MSFFSGGKSLSSWPKPQSSTPVFGSTSSLGARPAVDWFKSVVYTTASAIPRDNAENEEADLTDEIAHKLGEGAEDIKNGDNKDSTALVFFKSKSNESGGKEKKKDSTIKNFSVFGLPPELRLWVYRAALVPTGFYRLSRTRANKQLTATTNYIPNLLRTSHQVSNEAGNMLYAENTFYIDADNIFASTAGVICRDAFNKETWPLLQHIVLTLALPNDGVADMYLQRYRRCDWRQIQAMIGLKSVRIMVVEPELGKPGLAHKRVLNRVLHRLPATCSIEFGPKTDLDARHVAEWVEVRASEFRESYYVADSKELEEVVDSLPDSRRGKLSGSDVDNRWTSKTTGTTLV